jgi:CheY-like chemotaxis protein
MIEKAFQAEVVRAQTQEEALQRLREEPFSLVLVNRKLDRDHSDGLALIRTLKTDSRLASIPVMLISNFADYQEDAIDAGAVEGFGKRDLSGGRALEALRKVLG